MICPKCHYEWKIDIRRCKCGCYLDHGANENTWNESAWAQEHKKFIDSLPFEKHKDWYTHSGDRKEQVRSFKEFNEDTNSFLKSLSGISENEYKSFKSNNHLIQKIIKEAIGNDSEIFNSYGDIECADKNDSCKSILVINDSNGLGNGRIIEIADDDYKLLVKLIKRAI